MRTDLIKYVRTDKNGTKIYYDFTCPRCCGYGELDKWIFTGRTCYACGGSGQRAVAKVVKEYTPEYRAKLEARRQAKAKKEAEERAKYEAEHAEEIAAKEAARRQENNKRILRDHGLSDDGTGYVLTGDTYPIKEKIKAAGGRWLCITWVCPVKITAPDIEATAIDAHDAMDKSGNINAFDLLDMILDIARK